MKRRLQELWQLHQYHPVTGAFQGHQPTATYSGSYHHYHADEQPQFHQPSYFTEASKSFYQQVAYPEYTLNNVTPHEYPVYQGDGMHRTRRSEYHDSSKMSSGAHSHEPSPSRHPYYNHGSRHKDLKRKMVFHLHSEIRKPIHTITLEEISDLDRITDICLGTLRSMMQHKVHRRYLHHMNNSNSTMLESPTCLSNNGLHGNSFSTAGRRDYAAKMPKTMFNPKRGTKHSDRSTIVSDTPGQINPAALPPQMLKYMKKQSQALKRVAAAAAEGVHTGRQSYAADTPMLKHDPSIYAVESLGLDYNIIDDVEPTGTSTMSYRETSAFEKKARLLTPKETLSCKWLRLTQSQVEHLEHLIRAQGEEPIAHVHQRTVDYDIFADMRGNKKTNRSE